MAVICKLFWGWGQVWEVGTGLEEGQSGVGRTSAGLHRQILTFALGHTAQHTSLNLEPSACKLDAVSLSDGTIINSRIASTDLRKSIARPAPLPRGRERSTPLPKDLLRAVVTPIGCSGSCWIGGWQLWIGVLVHCFLPLESHQLAPPPRPQTSNHC